MPHRPSVLELWQPEGALEALEGYLAGGLRDGLVADVYLGYGLGETLRREPWPSPAEPCPLPVAAARIRAADADARPARSPFRVGEWEATWAPDDYGRAVCEVRAAIARGDVYQVNLVQHLSASFEGDPAGARGRACAAASAPPTSVRGRRLGDRLRVAGAVPRPARRAALDDADQGHPPDRRGHRRREGRRRAHDDRRSRAQRSLARLPGRIDSLAGVDGAARARGRDPPRLDRRGPPASGHRPGRDPARDLSRAARSPARRRSPRSITSLGSSPSGAAPRWARSGTIQANGDFELALTIRTFAVAAGRIHLWVGGGIVWDSEPEAEIEESWVKARPLLAAVSGKVAV